jgi:hypothetical protein
VPPWRADWLAGLREVDYPQQRVLAALPGPVAVLQVLQVLQVPVVGEGQRQALPPQKRGLCRQAVVPDRESVRAMLYRLRVRPPVAGLVVTERLKRPMVCNPLRRTHSPAVQPNPRRACRRPPQNPALQHLEAENKQPGKRIQGQVSHSLMQHLPRPMLYRLRVRPSVVEPVVAARLKRPRAYKRLLPTPMLRHPVQAGRVTPDRARASPVPMCRPMPSRLRLQSAPLLVVDRGALRLPAHLQVRLVAVPLVVRPVRPRPRQSHPP